MLRHMNYRESAKKIGIFLTSYVRGNFLTGHRLGKKIALRKTLRHRYKDKYLTI